MDFKLSFPKILIQKVDLFKKSTFFTKFECKSGKIKKKDHPEFFLNLYKDPVAQLILEVCRFKTHLRSKDVTLKKWQI